MKKLLTLILLQSSLLFAKVEPKNFNFKLDEILMITPGKVVSTDELTSNGFEIFGQEKEYQIYQKAITHLRYKFYLYIQIHNATKTVTDLHTRLPNYFLHDPFYQALINRFGKQQKYFNENEHSLYKWQREDFNILYEAGCTITCFPISLNLELVKKSEDMIKVPSLYKKLLVKPPEVEKK